MKRNQEKNVLNKFAARIVDPKKTEIRKTQISSSETHSTYPHGERGDFRKITVTLPPDVYEVLVEESARRKIAREPNHLLAAIVREAVVSYLSKK